MTIIVFLVDTSASMNQRTYLGTSLLDISKGAVENFMKIRARDTNNSRWDRYMLLTFEDPPANIKAGWKESHATFTSELKNLKAVGLSSMGAALKHTFDLLNVNRMQTGIDTYGQGRCPFYLEPAVIICITDGRALTTQSSVQPELNLPMNNPVPGSELTKEPFRWDQRLFSLVLRIPATPPIENHSMFIPSAENSPIDVMCEVTGGRSYAVQSQRMLLGCLESLVQKVQYGVVINFEKIGPDPSPVGNEENQDNNIKELDDKKRANTPTPSAAWHSSRKLILVPRSAQKGYSVGHWPIPEAFWPDPNTPSLPPRSAHPIVKFSCTPCEPLSIDNLPFDKYELEPSPLTQYILERRQSGVAWQVFVSNSAKYSDIGHPFGYIKASTNLQSVNLFVMPYNYPVLLPLLDELMKVHKLKPTQKWRQQFDNYLKTMPVYYATPLKRALARVGIHNLVPDNMESCLSYSVISYLKKLKNQAKVEYERLVSSVGQKVPLHEGIKVTARSQTSILQHKDFHQIMEHLGHDLSTISHLKQELAEYNTFTLTVPNNDIKRQVFRNPFDIARRDLLDQVRRMRANLFNSSSAGIRLQSEDQLHSVPVQQMGNYQEYLKRQPTPLRELETQPTRLHTFGNPFKVNKNLMIDEADEAMPGQQVRSKRQADTPPPSPGPRKRKPGPLPKDYKRPITPPVGTVLNPVAAEQFDHHAPVNSVEQEGQNEDEDLIIDIDTVPGESDSNLLNHTESQESVANHIDQPLNHNDAGGANSWTKLNHNNHKREPNAGEHNVRLTKQLIKELKKPGKNYDKLFEYLNTVQGNLDMRRIVVRNVMHEAMRFKRKMLLQMLEQFERSMIKAEIKKQRTQNNVLKVDTR